MTMLAVVNNQDSSIAMAMVVMASEWVKTRHSAIMTVVVMLKGVKAGRSAIMAMVIMVK